jgi:hypothetical protein
MERRQRQDWDWETINVSSNNPVLISRQTSADHQAKDGMHWLSGAINHQSSIHNYHDENHFQERYISSDIVSILIQDLSSFKDDSSVAFSMAHSVMLNNVEIYL